MEPLEKYQLTVDKADRTAFHLLHEIEINNDMVVVFDTLGININSTIKTPLNTNKNND